MFGLFKKKQKKSDDYDRMMNPPKNMVRSDIDGHWYDEDEARRHILAERERRRLHPEEFEYRPMVRKENEIAVYWARAVRDGGKIDPEKFQNFINIYGLADYKYRVEGKENEKFEAEANDTHCEFVLFFNDYKKAESESIQCSYHKGPYAGKDGRGVLSCPEVYAALSDKLEEIHCRMEGRMTRKERIENDKYWEEVFNFDPSTVSDEEKEANRKLFMDAMASKGITFAEDGTCIMPENREGKGAEEKQ